MEAVRSDHQIELTSLSAVESDVKPRRGLFNAIQTVAEYRFYLAFDLAEKRCRPSSPRAMLTNRPCVMRENASARNPAKCCPLWLTTLTSRTTYPWPLISGNKPMRSAMS